jgi:hypothetical protein
MCGSTGGNRLATAIASIATALVVVATPGRAAPRTGTWSVVNREGGREYSCTLAITRVEGDLVEGFYDGQVTGQPMAIEVLSGMYDAASRKLRLTGRQFFTKYDHATIGPGTHTFEAILSADGQELLNFVSVGNPADSTCRFSGERIPPHPPLVKLALRATDDRAALYQQLSNDFIIDGVRVINGPDRRRQAQLTRCADPRLRELARVRQALQMLADDTRDRTQRLRGELKDGMPADVYWFVAETLNDASCGNFSLSPLVDLLNSDTLARRFEIERRKLALHIQTAMVLNGVRRSLRQEFEARKLPQLDAAAVSVVFVVGASGNAAVTVRNNSGRMLRNCSLVTHLVVDQGKMDAYETQFWQGKAGFLGMASIAGVNVIPAVEADRAVLAFNRIDKGNIAFVPEWEPGATLELDVARPDDVTIVGRSIDVWVGCDDGTAAREVNIEAARDVLSKHKKVQSDSKPRPPRRAKSR